MEKSPLEGSVLKYIDLTKPVAEDDWEALNGLEGRLVRNVEDLERPPILEVSPDQELVIPASVIAKMGVRPGQKFILMSYFDTIRLMPLVSHEEAYGSMPGLDTTIIDHEDDEERV